MTEMNEDIRSSDNQIIDVKTDVHTQNLFGDPSQNVFKRKASYLIFYLNLNLNL